MEWHETWDVLGFLCSVALAHAQGGGATRWWEHVVARAMGLDLRE